MVVQMILLAVASLLGSAALFRHRRVLTYVAAAGVIWEAQWLFLTLLDRTILSAIFDNPRNMFRDADTEGIFLVGSVVLGLTWAALWWRKRKRGGAREEWHWQGDIVAAIVLVLVLAASGLIFTRNSFSETGDWVMHGFFNGDTATLLGVTQRALTTTGLVHENPFAAGGFLEYPSLLHAGLATVWSGLGNSQAWVWLPLLTYIQIFITIPMFFLLWDVVLPPPRQTWKFWLGVPSHLAVEVSGGLLALYVIMLSWESYVYPQGHFFLVGMFLFMAALLAKSWGGSVRQTFPQLGVAVMLGIVLLFSNAVTGTAAVLLKVVYDGLHVVKRGQRMPTRVGWAVGVLFWLVMFFLFVPGNGSLGIIPRFSYTAAQELGRLAPMLILVLVGMLLTYERKLFLSLAALGMMVLALVTFVFSTRDIVIENASRFFYHAVLIAFPLAVVPLIRGYYWFNREFVRSSRAWLELVVGWGTLVVVVGIFLLPAGASVASTHDNLMFKDEQRVSRAEREAMEWVSSHTYASDVFLASAETPFLVPMLSGRAMLRSDFWLSPDDVTLVNVKAAFAGNAAAQEMVVEEADYVVVRGEEEAAWEALPEPPVFKNADVAIYSVNEHGEVFAPDNVPIKVF